MATRSHRILAGLGIAVVAIGAGITATVLRSANWDNIHGGSTQPSNTTRPSDTAIVPIPTELVTFPPNMSPLPSPTEVFPTQRPTGFYEEQGTFVFVTEQGLTLTVPQVPGLTAELRDSNVVYVALPDNPYKLKQGQYAGAYKTGVSMEIDVGILAQTGGVVLTSKVANKLVVDRLAGIDNQSDKWTIPLPLDITNTHQMVTITFEPSKFVSSVQILRLDYSETLPTVSIIPGRTDLAFLTSGYGPSYFDTIFLFASSGDHIIPGKEMHYITVASNDLHRRSKDNIVRSVSFGSKVGDATGPSYIVYADSLNGWNITIGRILEIDNTPIFVASSN